jgi:hypothetical protein
MLSCVAHTPPFVLYIYKCNEILMNILTIILLQIVRFKSAHLMIHTLVAPFFPSLFLLALLVTLEASVKYAWLVVECAEEWLE